MWPLVDRFYRNPEKEWSDIGIIPLAREISVTTAAAQVDSIYAVPNDKILWLLNFMGRAQGGGAQTVSSMILWIADDQTHGLCKLNEKPTSGAAVEIILAPQQVIVPPKAIVFLRANFSAGVSANISTIELNGILLPRGNVGGI